MRGQLKLCKQGTSGEVLLIKACKHVTILHAPPNLLIHIKAALCIQFCSTGAAKTAHLTPWYNQEQVEPCMHNRKGTSPSILTEANVYSSFEMRRTVPGVCRPPAARCGTGGRMPPVPSGCRHSVSIFGW
jgi:hypothetical protein